MPEIHARNAVPRGTRRPAGVFGMVLVLLIAMTAMLNVTGCNSDDPSSPEQSTTLNNILAVTAEPDFTAGLSNTVAWSIDGGATALPDGWSYQAQSSADPTFTDGVVASDWVAEGQYTFADLTDNVTYYYRVKARDNQGAESEWSQAASSTQDASVPIAFVAELDSTQTSLLFTLDISAEDVGSGIGGIELWFSKNGGELQLYGPVEPGSVSFQTDEGGPHEFVALATDVAGNTQAVPEVAQAGTEVPEPIILVDSGGYAWDVTNAVLKHNIHLQWWAFGLGRFTIKPAIEPIMIGPGDAGWPGPDNIVDIVAVDIGGDQRAYKIGDLAGREVADDVVNGVPIAATY